MQTMCGFISPSGIAEIGSAYSGMTKDLTTPCSDDVMLDEDANDWLHTNLSCIPQFTSVQEIQNVPTSNGGHGQRSFVERSAYSEKKRQRDSSEQKRQRERERYAAMSDGQKEVCLHNNRQYKKMVREHNSPFMSSPATPVMQTQSSKINQTGIVFIH